MNNRFISFLAWQLFWVDDHASFIIRVLNYIKNQIYIFTVIFSMYTLIYTKKIYLSHREYGIKSELTLP